MGSKIKGKSLVLKINNCSTGNLSKFIIPKNYNRIPINKSIKALKLSINPIIKQTIKTGVKY